PAFHSQGSILHDGTFAIGLAQSLRNQAAFGRVAGAGRGRRVVRSNHDSKGSGLFAWGGLALAFGQSSIGIGAWAGDRTDSAITCGGVRAAKGLVRAIFLAIDNALALDRVLQLAANIAIDDSLANQLDLFGFTVVDSADTFSDHQFKFGWIFLANRHAGALADRGRAVLETCRILLDRQLVCHQGHGAASQDDVALVDRLLGN